MHTHSLVERIDNCIAHARFTDFFHRQFNSSDMQQMYETEQSCPLSSTEAIVVPLQSLRALTSELDTLLGVNKSPVSGAIGNGLYLLMGTSGSPRLPPIEEYAKILVLAAARIGSERVSALFSGWLDGTTIRTRSSVQLQGIETQELLKPIDGMRIETLPPTVEPIYGPMRIDEYGRPLDLYNNRTMFTLEYESIPGLYDPETFRENFPHASTPNPSQSRAKIIDVSALLPSDFTSSEQVCGLVRATN